MAERHKFRGRTQTPIWPVTTYSRLLGSQAFRNNGMPGFLLQRHGPYLPIGGVALQHFSDAILH